MIEDQTKVTIIIVPRERFNFTKHSLENVYEHTKLPFKLVYVDGNSPKHIKIYLESQSRQKGFRLIRTDRYLTPNQARNLGLCEVKSKYVLFMDNDVLVTPSWLETLIQCAEETGAWLVGPLYLDGRPELHIIHGLRGIVHFEEENGRRIFREEHPFKGKRLDDLPIPLERELCELLEFHCMLVRTEVFTRFGILDEKLLSLREHHDLCLTVQEAGGSIYFEPNAVVSYVAPKSIVWSDLAYFMLRWSEAWNLASIRHFYEKWNLDMDENSINNVLSRASSHRFRLLTPFRKLIHRIFTNRGARWVEPTFLFPMEKALNRCLAPYISKKHWKGLDQDPRLHSNFG